MKRVMVRRGRLRDDRARVHDGHEHPVQRRDAASTMRGLHDRGTHDSEKHATAASGASMRDSENMPPNIVMITRLDKKHMSVIV